MGGGGGGVVVTFGVRPGFTSPPSKEECFYSTCPYSIVMYIFAIYTVVHRHSPLLVIFFYISFHISLSLFYLFSLCSIDIFPVWICIVRVHLNAGLFLREFNSTTEQNCFFVKGVVGLHLPYLNI